jgi:hypothetical protein
LVLGALGDVELGGFALGFEGALVARTLGKLLLGVAEAVVGAGGGCFLNLQHLLAGSLANILPIFAGASIFPFEFPQSQWSFLGGIGVFEAELAAVGLLVGEVMQGVVSLLLGVSQIYAVPVHLTLDLS